VDKDIDAGGDGGGGGGVNRVFGELRTRALTPAFNAFSREAG